MTKSKYPITLDPIEQRKAIIIINRLAGIYDRGDMCRGCDHFSHWKRDSFSNCVACGVFAEGRNAYKFAIDQKVKLENLMKGVVSDGRPTAGPIQRDSGSD